MKSYIQIILLILLGFSTSALLAQGSRFSEEDIHIQELLIEASKEKLLKNYESAASLYEKTIALNRAHPNPHFELARVYFLLDKKEEGLKELRTAIRLDGENIWYQTFLAEVYGKDGWDKEAASIYQQLAQKYKDNDYYYFQWAYHLVKAEQGEEAIAVFNQVEAKTGITEEITKRKHKIWHQLGKKKEAAKEYEQLVSKYPDNIDYRHFLARYLVQIGEQKKAKKQYETIIQLSPEDARANLALASFDNGGKKGNNAAYIETLQELFKREDVLIDVKIAKLYPYVVKISKSDPALQEQVLALGKTLVETHQEEAKAHAIYGDLLYQLDKTTEALTQYQTTLKLDDTSFPVWENIMQIYVSQKEYDQLVSLTEDAMDLFPNQGVAYLYHGIALKEKGDYEDAISSLELVLLMSSKSPALKKNAYTALGEVYKKMEKFKLSEDAFNHAKAIIE